MQVVCSASLTFLWGCWDGSGSMKRLLEGGDLAVEGLKLLGG